MAPCVHQPCMANYDDSGCVQITACPVNIIQLNPFIITESPNSKPFVLGTVQTNSVAIIMSYCIMS